MVRGRQNVNARPLRRGETDGASRLRSARIPCRMRHAFTSEDRMKNYLDGGEAILEAFRKLKIDYIMSSPGSEWSPVWEALARQKLENRAGPTFIESWHETLAGNMAAGYTLITEPPQAVLLRCGRRRR